MGPGQLGPGLELNVLEKSEFEGPVMVPYSQSLAHTNSLCQGKTPLFKTKYRKILGDGKEREREEGRVERKRNMYVRNKKEDISG